jgi:hypothetical protein
VQVTGTPFDTPSEKHGIAAFHLGKWGRKRASPVSSTEVFQDKQNVQAQGARFIKGHEILSGVHKGFSLIPQQNGEIS